MIGNNKLLILVLIAIACVFSTAGYILGRGNINILKGKVGFSTTSSNILLLTNPVTNFSGKVDKISGNSIWVSQEYTIALPPVPPNLPTAAPGQVVTIPPLPVKKTLTYKVNITSNTQINKPSLSVNYLIRQITPPPLPKLTINDIKTGQVISIVSWQDIRTLTSDEFGATSIQLPAINNMLSGKIIGIKDNIIYLKAILPQTPATGNQQEPQTPREIEYAIAVTSNTEISRMGQTEPPKEGETPKPPKAEEYQLSDLKTDMQVTIFTDSDVNSSQKLTALRIEPQIIITATPTPTMEQQTLPVPTNTSPPLKK